MPGAVVPPDGVAAELVLVVPLVVAVEVLAGALALVWVWVVEDRAAPAARDQQAEDGREGDYRDAAPGR